MSSSIRVSLSEHQKWAQFHPRTEMIVTKQRGRVIFPHLDYSITGLDAHSLYTIQIHLERVDDIKYKYEEGQWVEAARGDPRLPIQHTEHKDGARSGEHWMGGTVSFASLKMTNDPRNENKKLVLVQSMHKYRPVITITRLGEQSGQEFRHDITEFMVVTAYQCEEICKLKVSMNKFAKGKHCQKRPASEDSDEATGTPKRSSSTSSTSSVSPMAWSPQNPFQGFHGIQMTPSNGSTAFWSHQNPMSFYGLHTPSPSTSSSSSTSPTGPFPQNPFPMYPHQYQNPQGFPNFYMNPAWNYPVQNQQNFMMPQAQPGTSDSDETYFRNLN